MYTLAQNLRLAFRQIRNALGFALTVILTLALGIGATTGVFSLVEGILLRPLPFKNADRLILLGDHLGNSPNLPVTAREIATYSSSTGAFSSMGAYITTSYELTGGTVPEEVFAARLTSGVFPTLAVQPLLGRVFTPQEEEAHLPLAVISYAFWLNYFHRDSNVLGSSLVLDRKTYSIIGVMPRDFEFPLQPGRLGQSQLWVPMELTPDELSELNTGFWGYHMIARLKDGTTLPQAAQDADRVAHQVMRDFPVNMSAIHIRGDVRLLRESVVSNVRPLLQTLFFAVAIVLLIACVNVSGLHLVRSIRRRRDYAVRLVLGAPPLVILREAVLEGLLLSLAGGLLGLAFASIAIRTALNLLPESMPRVDSISVDSSVASFAFLLALACGTLCSLAPAFAALRSNAKLSESLKEGSRIGTGASSHSWLRSCLVVSEVAIAIVLLTASLAFLRSFQKMRAVDPGFRPDHVLVAAYQLPMDQYATETSVDVFNHAVVEQLSNKPAILAAGITSFLPASGAPAEAAYTIEGAPVEHWKLQFAAFAMTYGDYFQALGIKALEGRTFTLHDNSAAPLVVIVNQSMAKHSWPGQPAIGKRLHLGNPQKALPWATVVGVVADTKIGSRDEPTLDQLYFPAEQPAILFGSQDSGKLTNSAGGFVALRSALPPENLTQTLRSTIAHIDPLLPLQQVQPMLDVISNVEAPRRFNTNLITSFSLGALLLAITGIYAVVAFTVSLRTQEIAIRMALGAQRVGIARLVLVSGAKLALFGCVIGLLASLAVSRLVGSFLFDVSATDPFIYAAAVLLMMFLALLASLIPAARAASTDLIDVLRSA
ncbi:MAG TPA: ABC transporter permease [Candidatus Acidoferrum sp.]|nr:ABC transporter permease [Candidatus Acidoferrum sp.]